MLMIDDTKIWRKIISQYDLSILQNDINYLDDWAVRNKMCFNLLKCKAIPISLSQPVPYPFPYTLSDAVLKYVNCEKDLGVDITPKLLWNHQCNRLYSKACQQLGIVKRNGHIVVDSKSRRALYLSLVRSQFENCSVVWRPTTKSLMDKLESLQKRAIKWIFSEENHSYSPETYVRKCKEIDILPLSSKFDLNDLVFFHRVINDLTPLSLPEYFSFYQGSSRLRICHLDSLSIVSSIIPRSTQSYNSGDNPRDPLSRSFFYRTHLVWNNLPLDIRQITSPRLFKAEVTKHLWKSIISSFDSHDCSSSDMPGD